MTRRGLLAPLLATVATAACAPLVGEGVAPVPLGPPGWRMARAAYGADPRQSLRLYRPARAGGSPILVLLPDGEPGAADERAARDLTERGFVVVLADRRAAPGSPYPAFIADGASAVAWAARRLGIPATIVMPVDAPQVAIAVADIDFVPGLPVLGRVEKA